MAAMTATAVWTVLWPALLPWLVAAIVPWLIAVWPLRDPRRIRWAATDMVAAAARRAGLGRRGVPWLLVALRGGVLAAIALAAARPIIAPPHPSVGIPLVVGTAARRIEIVAGPAADSAVAISRAVEALAATPSAIAAGGPPAVDLVEPHEAGMPCDGRRLVVLCDGAVPRPEDAGRIAAAVREGSGLMVCLGPDTLASVAFPQFATWLRDLAGLGIEAAVPLASATIDAAGIVDDRNVSLVGPTVETVAGVSFSDRGWTVRARTTEQGRPLVVETAVGGGRLCVTTIPLTIAAAEVSAAGWSDLAAWPVFLPFIDRLLADMLPADTAGKIGGEPRFIGLPLARGMLGVAGALVLIEWLCTWWLGRRAATGWIGRGLLLGSCAVMFAIWGGLPRERPPGDEPRRPLDLLIDTSPSMGTPDMPTAAGSRSRLAAAQDAFAADGGRVIRDVARGRDVRLATIATALDAPLPATTAPSIASLSLTAATTHASRIGDAIARLVSGTTPPAALVVATDGAISDGLSWRDVARLLHQCRVPLVAVPTGGVAPADGQTVPWGFRFTAIDAPLVCQLDERLEIAIRGSAAVPHDAPLAVVSPGGDGELVAIEGPPEGAFSYGFVGRCTDVIHADSPATATMQTRTMRLAGAAAAVATYPVIVTPHPIRVLIVDAVPRFEVRFLERLLAEDDRFEVSICLVEAAEMAGLRPTLPLPLGAADWLDYDVVVLGDLPIAAASAATAPAWAALREAAERDGLGIAWLPGRRWARDDLGLRSWLPATPRGAPAGGVRRVAVTPAGRRDAFAFLDTIAGESPFRPEVFAMPAAIALEPATRIMATARAADGTATPAVIAARLGAATVVGHVCETWRWRTAAGDDMHARYWTHLLPRLAEPRRLARLTPAMLAARPCDPVVGETLWIDIVPTRRTTNLTGSAITIDSGSGNEQRIEVPASEAGIATTVAVNGLAAGRHTLRLVPPPTTTDDGPRIAIDREIIVNEPAQEAAGGPAGIGPLIAAAAATGGAVVPLDRLDTLAAEIDRLEAQPRAAVATALPRWYESSAFAHLLVAAAVIAGVVAWRPREEVSP